MKVRLMFWKIAHATLGNKLWAVFEVGLWCYRDAACPVATGTGRSHADYPAERASQEETGGTEGELPQKARRAQVFQACVFVKENPINFSIVQFHLCKNMHFKCYFYIFLSLT